VSSSSPFPPRRRRAAALVAVALAVLVAAVVVVVLAGGQSKPVVAKLPRLGHRVGPESIFNPSGLAGQDPVGVLDELARLGVSRVQVYVVWANLAPDPQSTTRPNFDAADPAAYPATSWTTLDTIIKDATARKIGIDLAFTPPPPRWASGKGAPSPSTQPEWRPSAKEFGLFVRAVGTRYSGDYIPPGSSSPLPRVNFWAIWNEPNLGIMLAPETSHHSKVEESGWMYRELVNAAWSALHATGHGHDTVLIGEIAPAGATFGGAPGLFANMAPLRFLRALYCVDSSYRPLRGQAAALRHCPTDAAGSARFAADNPGLFHATAFSDHPYPQGLPPNKVTPDEPDYAELAEIPKLEHVLDTLQQIYGSKTKFPIYSTEFGYQTTPPDKEAGTVSPQTAAEYLNWSEYLSWRDPRIRSYDQYLLNDPASGSFASGLRTFAGQPKPGFYAYRMPIFLPVTETATGHPLEVWGCVRPVAYARRHSRHVAPVLIQFRPSGGGAFHTVRSLPITDRYGYFDVLQKFPGSGTVRLAWSYPHGPQIFSRTVDVVLH
jgi:hypothetical protein